MVATVQYKILFSGLGSIGQKHLENLISKLKERKIEFQIDALRTSNKPFDGITNTYTSYTEVSDDYDIIFITNPTSVHYETIELLKHKTKNMFIEKPIFDKIQNCEFSSGINYIACPLRFHPIIKELKKFVQNNQVFAFRAICSSYLPSWRKTKNYQDCYSAKKDMGGGVTLDLIHEIDYLTWIFGTPNEIKTIKAKFSNLEITSDDVAQYIFEFTNTLGSLHLDYFGQYSNKAKREIEVFSENDTLLFDVINNQIKSLKTNTVSEFSKEDIYLNEMDYFLDLIQHGAKEHYNMPSEALDNLKIALGENQ